jgi:putative membrane protein
MKINSLLFGRPAFQKSLVLATTLLTCAAIQANEHEDKTKQAGKEHKEHADKGGPITAEKFVKKAVASNKMEVQMGELGQQQGQNQQVKTLAAALVKDHSEANQKLQRIASSKNITLDKSSDHAKGSEHAKHQQHLDKLKSQSGAEFDKEFVRMALKHHKKDIKEFERAQTQLTDQELKSFVTETLPKLRQHYQMAQAAAKSVGVDEASLAAEIDAEDNTAAGAAAGGVSGSREKSSPDRPRSSLDGASDTDASGTVSQNNPSLKAEVDVNDADAEVEVENDKKIFKKDDGKVLGLSTDKNDGKFLGIIPNPKKDKDNEADASVEADIDVDADDNSVGGAASVESGKSKKDQ